LCLSGFLFCISLLMNLSIVPFVMDLPTNPELGRTSLLEALDLAVPQRLGVFLFRIGHRLFAMTSCFASSCLILCLYSPIILCTTLNFLFYTMSLRYSSYFLFILSTMSYWSTLKFDLSNCLLPLDDTVSTVVYSIFGI
jgi:hypothetical protein